VKFHGAGSPSAVDCHRLLEIAPPQFNLDHRAHLLRVVAVILGEEFKSLQRSQPGFVSMEQHLMQVFEKLTANDLLTLSTDELSAKFGCSRRHLSRLFQQHFGFSVAALRMELRMLRAISLLRDAGAKVNSVAEQCGFNHLGLFNNCFKRRFGTSPGRWRRLSQATPAATATSGTGKKSDCLHENDIDPVLGASNPNRPFGPSAVHLKNSVLGAAADQTTTLGASLAGLLDSVSRPRLNTFT